MRANKILPIIFCFSHRREVHHSQIEEETNIAIPQKKKYFHSVNFGNKPKINPMQTAHAYYDGQTIRLDEPMSLKKNDKLVVTVISNPREELIQDDFELACLNDVDSDDFLSKEDIQYYLTLQ
ncbi:MAG: hypothetical protein HYZ34_01645 [Ignavibacteriae bacterium]|nr:hypothetical protein [Ignavibacteriota bacterium]